MIRAKKFFLSFFLACSCLVSHSKAQSPLLPITDNRNFVVNEDTVSQAVRVLGYLTSQTAVLDGIARSYPHLFNDAETRKRAFDVTYGFPRHKAVEFLRSAVGETNLTTLQTKLADQAKGLVPNMTESAALQFFSEMDLRLAGQIDPPVLKAMLWLKFGSKPADEMRDWSVVFSSEGHPKSLGLNMRLSTPTSWKRQEGNRPHVVSKWTSQGGSGDMVITLQVREFEGKVAFRDVQEVERLSDWGWLMPDGFQFLNGAAVKMDRQPGLQTDMIGDRRVLDQTVTSRTRIYTIFPENRYVQLGCALGSVRDADPDWQEKRFDDLKEVCRSVALTLTFPDTWQ